MSTHLPKHMVINWRHPDEPDGPVHVLSITNLRIESRGHRQFLVGDAKTFCGLQPPPVTTGNKDDVTCEPCLAVCGGDAVDIAERPLRDVREPVTT